MLRESVMTAFRLVGRDFIKSFANPYILKWSLWWALGMCGNFQVWVVLLQDRGPWLIHKSKLD